MPNYRLVTAPATEPVTLAEAKLWCRIEQDVTDEDTLVNSLIAGARQYLEDTFWVPIITQTWAMQFDKDELNLLVWNINKAPLTSVSSITYYDSNNALQTLAASSYEVDIYGSPARFRIKTMPNVYDRMNVLQVNFVCGWANAAAVPQPIKDAMRMIIASNYENRQTVVTGTQVNEIPDAVNSKMSPYRNNYIFAPMNG